MAIKACCQEKRPTKVCLVEAKRELANAAKKHVKDTEEGAKGEGKTTEGVEQTK